MKKDSVWTIIKKYGKKSVFFRYVVSSMTTILLIFIPFFFVIFTYYKYVLTQELSKQATINALQSKISSKALPKISTPVMSLPGTPRMYGIFSTLPYRIPGQKQKQESLSAHSCRIPLSLKKFLFTALQMRPAFPPGKPNTLAPTTSMNGTVPTAAPSCPLSCSPAQTKPAALPNSTYATKSTKTISSKVCTVRK